MLIINSCSCDILTHVVKTAIVYKMYNLQYVSGFFFFFASTPGCIQEGRGGVGKSQWHTCTKFTPPNYPLGCINWYYPLKTASWRMSHRKINTKDNQI